MQPITVRRTGMLGALALAAGLLAVAPAPARAELGAVFTVNSPADGSDADFGGTFDGVCATTGGTCTLRAAVQEANDTGAADLVIVPPGTYSLTIPIGAVGQEPAEGDVDIQQDVTIDGAGPAQTIIDGAWASNPDRIFETQQPGADLTLTDMTIQDGVGQFDGGGIEVDYATLTATNVQLRNNSAPNGPGGGIAAGDGDALTLTNVAIVGNTTTRQGGGLFIDSAISSLTNVTISGNSADEDGGGIFASVDTTLNNVTVVGNTSDADAGGTAGDGGGVYHGGDTLRSRNSLVAGNTDVSGEAPDCSGTVTSEGHNLVQNPAGCSGLIGPVDITGQDPKVTGLGDHGGPTPTHALMPGSPAVDAGDPGTPGSGGTACAATDQRGLPRNCDVGAYELVLCQKVPVNRIGSEGNDALVGTAGADGLLSLGGNDTAKGLGGDDGLCGGGGKDKLLGGGGRDRLAGEAGKDQLKGGGGKDVMKGQGGKDTCVGGGGKDKATCENEKSI